MSDDDLEGGAESSVPPATDPHELPDVDPHSAAPFHVQLPGPPGVPNIDHEAVTQPPQFEVVVAVRNAVQDLLQRERPRVEHAIRETIEREMEPIQAQLALVNDPQIGVIATMKTVELAVIEASQLMAELRALPEKIHRQADERSRVLLERVEKHVSVFLERDQARERAVESVRGDLDRIRSDMKSITDRVAALESNAKRTSSKPPA